MDSNKPLVSVIMPTYNQADFIGESLRCLLEQTYENWECIIVNDGATDGTEMEVKSHLVDSRFFYYLKKHEGAAIAKNFGIERAQGDYILPLDSDDLIHPTYIEKAVDLLNKNRQLKLVYCEADLFGAENKKWDIPPFDYKLFLIYNMVFNSSLFRRADFHTVGGYDKNSLLEDWDLWMKLVKNKDEIYQIPEILFFYRIHRKGSVTNVLNLKDKRYINSMNSLYKNHIDAYLEYIGNPVELERERRELASIVRSADYKVAVHIMEHPLFKYYKKLRNSLKRMRGGK